MLTFGKSEYTLVSSEWDQDYSSHHAYLVKNGLQQSKLAIVTRDPKNTSDAYAGDVLYSKNLGTTQEGRITYDLLTAIERMSGNSDEVKAEREASQEQIKQEQEERMAQKERISQVKRAAQKERTAQQKRISQVKRAAQKERSARMRIAEERIAQAKTAETKGLNHPYTQIVNSNLKITTELTYSDNVISSVLYDILHGRKSDIVKDPDFSIIASLSHRLIPYSIKKTDIEMADMDAMPQLSQQPDAAVRFAPPTYQPDKPLPSEETSLVSATPYRSNNTLSAWRFQTESMDPDNDDDARTMYPATWNSAQAPPPGTPGIIGRNDPEGLCIAPPSRPAPAMGLQFGDFISHSGQPSVAPSTHNNNEKEIDSPFEQEKFALLQGPQLNERNQRWETLTEYYHETFGWIEKE